MSDPHPEQQPIIPVAADPKNWYLVVPIQTLRPPMRPATVDVHQVLGAAQNFLVQCDKPEMAAQRAFDAGYQWVGVVELDFYERPT